MKFSMAPILFLSFRLTCSFLFISNLGFSQNKIDSTDFYQNVLLFPNKDSNISGAFSYFEKEVEKDLKNSDTLKAVLKMRIITIGQLKMGAIYESETTAIRALGLLDDLPINDAVQDARKGLYIDLGKVYRNLESPGNALRYYDRALKVSPTKTDSLFVINNKGNVLADMGDHGLAEQEFSQAYKMSLQSTDSLAQARALDNWGYSQSKLRQPEALPNMLRALGIRLRHNDLTGTYSSYRHLAQYYHERGDREKANEYAQKAYQQAKLINSPSFLENALTNLLKIRSDSIANEYIALNDSIEKGKLKNRNKYAAMQYDIAKEREKTETNRLLQEREKRKRQTYQFLGALAVILGFAIYFIQRSQNRRNTLHQIYHTETRISKKVHDEVANDVYHLMAKIQGKTGKDDELLLDDLEHIYKKTRDISKENSAIELKENFYEQLNDLLLSYQNEQVKITMHNISKVDWKAISTIKKTTIYRVLQELMTNMKKHSKATQVLISFQQNGKKLQIKYVDNGVGCEIKNKNGLQNTENRIKAVKGTIIFDSTPRKGFRSTIMI